MGLWPFGRTKADVETTSRVVVLRARDAVALRAKVTVKFEQPQTQAVADQVLEISQDILRAVVREAPVAAAVLGFDAALAAEVLGRIPAEPAAVRTVEIAGLHIVGDPGHLAQPVAGPDSNPAWLHVAVTAAATPSSSERPPGGMDRLTPVQPFPAAKPFGAERVTDRPTPVQPIPAAKGIPAERAMERSTPVQAIPAPKANVADRSPERPTPVEGAPAKGPRDPFTATVQSPQPNARTAAPTPNVPIAAVPARGAGVATALANGPQPPIGGDVAGAAPQGATAATVGATPQPPAVANASPGASAATDDSAAAMHAAPATQPAAHLAAPAASPIAPHAAPAASPTATQAAPDASPIAPHAVAAGFAAQREAPGATPAVQPTMPAPAPEAPPARGTTPLHIAHAPTIPALQAQPGPAPMAAATRGPAVEIARDPGAAPARDPGPAPAPIGRAAGPLAGLPPGQRPGRLPIGRPAAQPPPDPAHRDANHRDAAHRDAAHREPGHRDAAHRDAAHREPGHHDAAHRPERKHTDHAVHERLPVERPPAGNHPGAYSGIVPVDSTPAPGAVRAREPFATTAGRGEGAALHGRASTNRAPSAPPPYLIPPAGRAYGPKRSPSSGSMGAVSPDDATARGSVSGTPPPVGLRPADEPSSSRNFGGIGRGLRPADEPSSSARNFGSLAPPSGRPSRTPDEPSASSRSFGLLGPPSVGPRSARGSNRPPPAAVAARRRVVAARLPLPTGAGPYEVARGLTPLFRDTAGRILVAFLRTYDLTVIRRVPFDAVEGDILSSLTAPVEGAPGTYTASHAPEIHRWREAFGAAKLDQLQREANLAAAALAHEMFTAEAVPSSMTAAVVEGLAGSAFGDPDMLMDLGRYLYPAHETTSAEALATMIEVAGEDMPPGLEFALDPLFASLREEVAAAAELAKEVMLTPS